MCRIIATKNIHSKHDRVILESIKDKNKEEIFRVKRGDRFHDFVDIKMATFYFDRGGIND